MPMRVGRLIPSYLYFFGFLFVVLLFSALILAFLSGGSSHYQVSRLFTGGLF